ncbi:hypothetical protein ACRRTK_000011 [Alexandromys fortis]
MKAETNYCKPNQPSTLGSLVGKLRIDDCNGVASSRPAIATGNLCGPPGVFH